LINNAYITEELGKKGIELVESENFETKLSEFGKDLSEDEIKYISLHRYVVYRKK